MNGRVQRGPGDMRVAFTLSLYSRGMHKDHATMRARGTSLYMLHAV